VRTQAAVRALAQHRRDWVGEDAVRVHLRDVDHVTDETGWAPTTTAAFAGAFQFREYVR
jgi:hypothetical protein